MPELTTSTLGEMGLIGPQQPNGNFKAVAPWRVRYFDLPGQELTDFITLMKMQNSGFSDDQMGRTAALVGKFDNGYDQRPTEMWAVLVPENTPDDAETEISPDLVTIKLID